MSSTKYFYQVQCDFDIEIVCIQYVVNLPEWVMLVLFVVKFAEDNLTIRKYQNLMATLTEQNNNKIRNYLLRLLSKRSWNMELRVLLDLDSDPYIDLRLESVCL